MPSEDFQGGVGVGLGNRNSLGWRQVLKYRSGSTPKPSCADNTLLTHDCVIRKILHFGIPANLLPTCLASTSVLSPSRRDSKPRCKKGDLQNACRVQSIGKSGQAAL